MTFKGKLTVNEILDLVTSMDPNDKKNLEFLLTIKPKGYIEWFLQATEDDLKYAEELLKRAKNECVLKLFSEQKDEVKDTTQAQDILKKFQLKKE